MSKNKHMDLSDRIIIEKGLDENSSRKSIADTIGKDKSSVCKEIKAHAKMVPFSRRGVSSSGTYDCIFIQKCGFNSFCPKACENRACIPCKRKDSSSGVCNGCENRSSCKLTKKIYCAEDAQEEYEYTLSDSRIGWDLSYNEAKELSSILKPLLDQGQSIEFILSNHPEISYCEKTIYNYIDQGALSEFGITNMDLRRKVSRKMTKKTSQSYKPRKDNKYIKGRTYKDYEDYLHEHPGVSVVEMDTVYNDVSNGPFIQTFQFVDHHLMKGILHEGKTAKSMLDGLTMLHDLMGEKEFKKHAAVILTDRGSEFSAADEMEALGCHVFYCDPMCSWQKPHVENNHLVLRYVCPKGKDLKSLGLCTQEDMDLAFSHINSYGRESLNGRSPYETFKFFYPDSSLLENLNIKKVAPEAITLTPELLKK